MKQNLTHIKDVAKILGVTRQAVYKKLTALGKKPTKVGNKSFIDAETLKEIKDGKKVQPPVADVSPPVAENGDTATKQVDSELVNLLKKNIENLQQDKVALQRQVDIKDRQIEDLSASGRELRMLLANAQQHVGMLPSPIDEHLKPDYEPPPPAPKQPEMKSPKKKKKKKKSKKKK